MVDFRYHLVSIIAVFLALAIGVVVGTTALNGPVLRNLQGSNRGLITDKRTLQGQVRDLESEVRVRDGVVATLAPMIITGRLSGQTVVVVSAPDAPRRLRDDLLATVRSAGARVTGVVQVRRDLADPKNDAQVKDLVNRLRPNGVELPKGSAGEQAATELAAVLVEGGALGRPDTAATTSVVNGFRSSGLISVDGDAPLPAQLALLVTGDPPTGSDATAQVAAVRLLALRLDEASQGTVVAGTERSTVDGAALRAVRRDGDTSSKVSTVDNADTVLGRLATVLALQEQDNDGAGQYGTGDGASAALPELGS